MATSIQPSTLHFLIDLSINNYRVWFEDNREAYKLARANFLDFIQEIIDDLAHVDDSVHGLQAKDCAFRIYRDVRFNKDKSPYKVHFGASIKPGEGNRAKRVITFILNRARVLSEEVSITLKVISFPTSERRSAGTIPGSLRFWQKKNSGRCTLILIVPINTFSSAFQGGLKPLILPPDTSC